MRQVIGLSEAHFRQAHRVKTKQTAHTGSKCIDNKIFCFVFTGHTPLGPAQHRRGSRHCFPQPEQGCSHPPPLSSWRQQRRLALRGYEGPMFLQRPTPEAVKVHCFPPLPGKSGSKGMFTGYWGIIMVAVDHLLVSLKRGPHCSRLTSAAAPRPSSLSGQSKAHHWMTVGENESS